MATCEFNLELCRICFDVGAEIPIFEKPDTSTESIVHKLLTSINQKIEDTEGYPRHICFKCNNTVDLICDFIKTLKSSNNILLQGLQNIKQEQESFSDHEYYDEHTEEMKLTQYDDTKNIKLETHSDSDESYLKDNFTSLFNKNDIQIKKIKLEPVKGKKKKQQPLVKAKNKTNNIASSILDSNFKWTGSKCVISSTTIKKVKPRGVQKNTVSEIKRKLKREPAIKIPEITEPKTMSLRLCDICGKTLKQNESLKFHRKTHEEPDNIACTQCKKIFKYKEQLREHVRRSHREKNIVCSVCGLKFSEYNILNSHTRKVHEKHLYPTKLYQCSYCSKSYKSKSSMHIHERSVHTGLRPAMCSVCDASFFHEIYLKEHMRLHTGETPFKCPVCSRGYAQRGNMKSHIQHNHRLSQLTKEQLATIKPFLLRVMKP